MSTFDQRGQTVYGDQFNEVHGSGTVAEFVVRLQSLSAEVSEAPGDDETRADAQHEIQQAILSASNGNGKKTRERLERARQFVEAIAGTGHLVSAITDAIHACARIIGV